MYYDNLGESLFNMEDGVFDDEEEKFDLYTSPFPYDGLPLW